MDSLGGSPQRLVAVVGLGANLGVPERTFAAACARLATFARLNRASALYDSAPIGGPAQPAFVNAAALVEYDGGPEQLLARLLEVERVLGRRRGVRFGPRVLDLDLLWAARTVSFKALVRVPHPRLTQRAFALRPLLDVAPAAVDPITGRPYTKYLSQLQGQQIRCRPGSAGGKWAGPCRLGT